MLDVLVPVGAIDERVAAVPSVLVCWWAEGGPDAAWVHVAGELDIATAPQLEQKLRLAELRARLVVLDLRELTFIDCCGVRTVLDASSRAGRAGGRLVLLRGPRSVDRLFTLTGCSDQLEMHDLDPGAPPVLVLLQLAEQDLAR